MLVMSKGALSIGQAETYYQEKYSRDDYYTESQRVTGNGTAKPHGRWGSQARYQNINSCRFAGSRSEHGIDAGERSGGTQRAPGGMGRDF